MNTSRDGASSFTADLRQLLFYHQQLGIACYPENDLLRKFLALQPCFASGGVLRQKSPQQDAPVPSPQAPISQKKSVAPSLQGSSSSCFYDDIRHWRLEEGSDPVRLLLVGDRVRGSKESGAKLFFGRQEDDMVRKMVAALGLPGSAVAITNVLADDSVAGQIKVGPEYAMQYGSNFFAQIEALAPQYICAMGSIAAKVLLQTTQPLSLLRGRLHECQFGGYQCLVLVTYHPNFLLQNVEMKRPTWGDLQLLGRRMGLLS